MQKQEAPDPASSPPTPSAEPFENYFFELEAENLNATVTLNDVPLITVTSEDSVKRQMNVTRWAAPTSSKLRVQLSRPTQGGDQKATFSASFFKAGRGEKPNRSSPLWSYTWAPTNDAPREMQQSVDVPTKTPSALWTQAKPVALDAKTQQEIVDYVAGLHALFAAGNHRALADALKFRGEELSLTEGLSREEGVRDQRDFLEQIMAPSEFAFHARPLDTKNLTFGLIGGSRVVHVRSGSDPALLSTEGQGLDIYIANILGRWVAVR